MRSFRDRDFLQTSEGFFFCVVGPLHPPERVISYIKYVPSESGIWGTNGKRFSRILPKYTIPNLLETFKFIKQNFPYYLYNSPVDNITITAVPHESIKEHFKPETKLDQLRKTSELDSLQKKLIQFIKLLSEISRVSESSFGVTGSLLLDIHQPTFSDLDIIIYGVKDCWKLKETLAKNLDSVTPFKRLEGKALEEWCIKKSMDYPLTLKEASKLYERKWNLGFFEGTWVSIHPVKLEKEIKEKYGDKSYIPYGQVTIEAVVKENVNSIFLPATYQIEDVKFLDTQQVFDVTEVVSYEGLYDSLAENNEKIQVKGKLEKINEKRTNQLRYRVLVGSTEGKGKEYIKVVE